MENGTLYLEYENPKEVVSKYFKILNHLGVDKGKSCIIVKQNTMKEKLLGDNNSEEHLLIVAIQLWNSGVAYQKKKALEYAGKQISKWFGGARNKSSYYCPKDITSVFAWRIFINNVATETNSAGYEDIELLQI